MRDFDYLRCVNSRHKQCANTTGFLYRKLEPMLLVLDVLADATAKLVPEPLA